MSFVVGAGSVRDTGEIYTAIDPDCIVVDIPDWLVDWLWADIEKYWDAKEQIRADRYAQKELNRKLFKPAKRAADRKLNLPEGFDVYEDDIYWFLLWRAGQLAGLGCESKVIEVALVEQVQKFCHNGVKFAHTEKGRETIHKIANDSGLKMGDASWFYRKKEEGIGRGSRMTVAPKPKSSSRLQFEAMVEIIKSIPNSLTSAKAYDRLRRDLTKAGFDFDGYSNTDQQRVKRARAEAGFEVREKMWVRR